MRKLATALALSGSLAAGGLAGAILGVPSLSGAQTEEGADDQPSTSTDRLHGPIESALSQLVADGTLTQEQADKVGTALREEMATRGHRGGPHRGLGHHLEAAAEVLGLTTEELAAELRAGKTLAAIAGEHDVEVSAVVDTLVAEANERIDAAVEDGKLDQERADELKAELPDRITTMVNEGRPAKGRFHHGPRAGIRGSDGADADQTAA